MMSAALEGSALEQRLRPVFARVVAARWWILAVYLLCIPVAAHFTLKIEQDSAIENMVVASDPDVAATRAFQATFAEPSSVLLLVEAEPLFDDRTLGAVSALESGLNAVDGVTAYSALTIWRRLHPRAALETPPPERLRSFVSQTDFFRRQGLAGEGFLAVAASFDDADPAVRDRILEAIDRLAATTREAASVTRVRRVGKPWVDSWLERETAAASARYFPVFCLFVICLILGLYRSPRALFLILPCLGVAVLFGMAWGGILGYAFTVVSGLIPLSLLVTTTASLVYLHSRFVDQPRDVALATHRVNAMANKFLAVTASMFAATVGFAALAVSQIRPIRELGLWTAGGLLLAWLVCFTLYPALQAILRPPTRRQRRVAGQWMRTIAAHLPGWSYRWRWPLLVVSTALALAGAAALFGIPGGLAPMHLETDALHYVNPQLPIVHDAKWFSENVLGLTSAQLWITTPPDKVLDPGVLVALDRLSRELEAAPEVGSVVGLPTIMRLRRQVAAGDDAPPGDAAGRRREADELELLLFSEAELQSWVDLDSFASTYLTLTTAAGSADGYPELESAVAEAWTRSAAAAPMLGECSWRLVGDGLLQYTIGSHLVPTLTESFAITFAVIFLAFLVVFRSAAARLNAMVPSLFAILVTFLVMRLTGIPLNVATILIATTILGATENDQIHFFYHFGEGRRTGSTHQALSHSVRVAGHAIFFATMINAGGFMALALSDLPPMRQFGFISALAFLLALLADFSFLPAALWVFFRDRPDPRLEAGDTAE